MGFDLQLEAFHDSGCQGTISVVIQEDDHRCLAYCDYGGPLEACGDHGLV